MCPRRVECAAEQTTDSLELTLSLRANPQPNETLTESNAAEHSIPLELAVEVSGDSPPTALDAMHPMQ